MAGKTTAFANNMLKLIFNGTAWANMADNASSSPLTNFYASLHTADPGIAGTQTSSETSYTSYVRQAIARSTLGFTVVNNTVFPVANIVFPMSTSGTPTCTHLGWGSAASSTGNLFYTGLIPGSVVVRTDAVNTVAGGAAGTVLTET